LGFHFSLSEEQKRNLVIDEVDTTEINLGGYTVWKIQAKKSITFALLVGNNQNW